MRFLPGLALLLLATAAAALRPVELRDLGTPKVAGIRIEHLDEKPIDNRELRAAMLTQEGKAFERRFLRADLSTIENLYRSRGYLDVDIVRRTFELQDDGDLVVTLKIDSGRRWHVAVVNLELADSSTTAAVLEPHLTVRPGDVFEYGAVLRDERGLLAVLNNLGHAHARVRNRLDLDSRRRQATVVFRVTAGPRMYFGPVDLANRDSLHTRTSLILAQLTFAPGDLYDPKVLQESRNRLSSTGLFRSVTLETPTPAAGDSVQPVVVRLGERRFVHLESRVFANNTEPGVSAKVEHGNFLGRGNRVGTDASLGQPLQGLTLYLTERRLLGSQLDLTVSAGVTDEWGQTRVFADPDDTTQFDLLTANHAVANELQLFWGDAEAAAFISGLEYNYPSVEHLWQVHGVLGRRWEPRAGKVYLANLTARWANSRNRPIGGRTIELVGAAAVSDDEPAGPDTTGGDDPFDGDDPFGGDDPFAGKPSQGAGAFPYDDPDDPGIHADATWVSLLTNRARTLDLQLDLQRDTRDDQLSPTRGKFARVAGLFAYELGGSGTRVLQGEVEARHYQRLGPWLLWAQAARGLLVGSLRQDRNLPQTYWTKLGGEGSVRGVERESIQSVGGGRAGYNVRNELRATVGTVGAVLFWDRGAVFRRLRDASWKVGIDGYGAGLRWNPGLPLRFDLGWSEASPRRWVYLSVGQAF